MTERIDLDELDAESEERADDRPNRGDWFWRGEGDPDDSAGARADEPTHTGAEADETSHAGAEANETSSTATDHGGGDADRQPMPRVPRETDGAPVGIPVETGGAGAGEVADARRAEPSGARGGFESGTDRKGGEAAGHAGEPDGMTLAFTYGAITRVSDPQRVVADASGWTDWLGIVGDVEAHVINKLQRDHAIDVDFFNGSGSGPAERLAGIDERSMFYADRMAVVGREGVDEPIAKRAGWEFVPLKEAAEKAGWTLSDE